MKSRFVQPPLIALWLLKLFTHAEQAETIEGDLLVELSFIASHSGNRVARKWYWRQMVKTIPHLAAGKLRAAPLSTTAAVVGGYLLFRLVYVLPDNILMAATERYLSFWQRHFHAYVFLATDGMLIVHLVALTLLGCVVALAANDREMIPITLGIIVGAMGGVFLLWSMTAGQVPWDGWMLALRFADPLAIVTGGVLVRMCRVDSRLQAE
jgi:hypothetical protein